MSLCRYAEKHFRLARSFMLSEFHVPGDVLKTASAETTPCKQQLHLSKFHTFSSNPLPYPCHLPKCTVEIIFLNQILAFCFHNSLAGVCFVSLLFAINGDAMLTHCDYSCLVETQWRCYNVICFLVHVRVFSVDNFVLYSHILL